MTPTERATLQHLSDTLFELAETCRSNRPSIPDAYSQGKAAGLTIASIQLEKVLLELDDSSCQKTAPSGV